jgi:hypothetical protein
MQHTYTPGYQSNRSSRRSTGRPGSQFDRPPWHLAVLTFTSGYATKGGIRIGGYLPSEN